MGDFSVIKFLIEFSISLGLLGIVAFQLFKMYKAKEADMKQIVTTKDAEIKELNTKLQKNGEIVATTLQKTATTMEQFNDTLKAQQAQNDATIKDLKAFIANSIDRIKQR